MARLQLTLLLALLLVFPIAAQQVRVNGTSASGGGGGAAAVTDVLTIANAAAPATLNLSTEGTRDWAAVHAVGLPRSTPNTFHAKVANGGILNSFDWIYTASSTTFVVSVGGTAMTTTAGDDMQPVWSGATACVGITAAGDTGAGWRIRVPAAPFTQTLKIYAAVYSGALTVTGRLNSSTLTPVTSTVTTAAGAARSDMYTLTFAASSGELVVTGLLTTNLGSSPNVVFTAATLF